MHDISLLQDLVTIILVSIFIIVTFQKLKVPPIIGFLIAGMVVGPHGFHLISKKAEIEMLSEIGIIFLMFMIGVELSIKELISMWRKVFVGGSLQVFGTIILVGALGFSLGFSIQQSFFIGFLLALSCTAIALQLLHARGETKFVHGRASVGILIFQDLIVIPAVIFMPILTGKSEFSWGILGLLFLKIVAVLTLIVILARYVVPFVFKLILKTQNQGLFLVSVLGLCFSIALLTNQAGMSLPLGALFAGLIISESDYSHQAVVNVLPFRELFVSFFFVATGMLLDLKFVADNFLMVILLTLSAMAIKMIVLWGTAFLLNNPPKSRLMLLFYLFQVGEFSLLLSLQGKENGLITAEHYQYFLAVSIVTMALTPFVVLASNPIANFILKRKKMEHSENPFIHHSELTDHLVIIGYGLNGENLCRAAKKANIPYQIVELDNEAFSRAKQQNQPVIFGDARRDLILKLTHIENARVVAIAIGDAQVTKEIVRAIREHTKTAYIIVRTTQISEIDENLKLGADFVIPEEYETGIQIFTRVLNKYMIPIDEIHSYANSLRASNYSMLTNDESCIFAFQNLRMPERGLYTLKVEQSSNSVVGKKVFESQIRQRFGVNLLAIRRDYQYVTEINNETKILQGDLLYFFASVEQIQEINKYLALKNDHDV